MEQQESRTAFVEYFGNSPYIRVLDFLLQGQDFDYSMTEVARKCQIGWSVFTKVWSHLLAKHLIIPTRTIGNAKLFTLNKSSPVVKKLIKLDFELSTIPQESIQTAV